MSKYEDGIICPEQFAKEPKKILFIAKEPNSSKEDNSKDSSFIEVWSSKVPFYPFSHRVAELAYGLLNGFGKHDDITVEKDSKQYERKGQLQLETLRRVAFINVKKTGGLQTSKDTTLLKHIRENKETILSQIDQIAPTHIVFFFSNVNLAHEIVGDGVLQPTGYGCYAGSWGDRKVITCYHPSVPIGSSAVYALLKANAEACNFIK